MPKQRLTLNDFSGGLNTYQYPRDLEFNELQRCENLTFKRGKSLVSAGSMTTHGTVNTQAATIACGYGLFSFESDYSPVEYEDISGQSTNVVFHDDQGDGIAAGSGTVVGTFS